MTQRARPFRRSLGTLGFVMTCTWLGQIGRGTALDWTPSDYPASGAYLPSRKVLMFRTRHSGSSPTPPICRARFLAVVGAVLAYLSRFTGVPSGPKNSVLRYRVTLLALTGKH